MPSGGNAAAAYQQQEKNPILLLNDIRKDCVYELIDDDGPTPDKKFAMKLHIDGKTFYGTGPSKKATKAACAVKALKHPAVNADAAKYKAQQAQKQKQDNNQNKQGYSGKNAARGHQNMVQKTNQVDGGFRYINGKRVCNLYLSSLCLRGKNCPYLHPEYSTGLQTKLSSYPQVPLKDTYTWLQFCENYMHLRCPQSDCKFLHVSQDDVEIYRTLGKIPPHIVEQAVRKAIADDATPPGVSPPCKAFLDGQCSWYSCPFRHVSRKDFSKEVLESLYKHFDKNIRLRENVCANSRGLLDTPGQGREMYGSRSRELAKRILDVPPPMGFESRLSDWREYERPRPHMADPDMLVKGMRNIMKVDDVIQQKGQKELLQLHEELLKLQVDKARMQNNYQTITASEDNFFRRGQQNRAGEFFRRDVIGEEDYYVRRGMPRDAPCFQGEMPRDGNYHYRREIPRRDEDHFRSGALKDDNIFLSGQTRTNFHDEENIYQEQIRRLRNENEDMRKMLIAKENERQDPYYQLEHRNVSNPLYGDGILGAGRSNMRTVNPELHNFDELLESGIGRLESQIKYKRMGVPVSVNTANYLDPQQVINQIVKEQHQQKQIFAYQKNPVNNAQKAGRPSYQVMKKANKNQGQKFQQKNRYVKKSNSQLLQQLKSPHPQQFIQQQPQQQNQLQQKKPKNKQWKQNAKNSSKNKPSVTKETSAEVKPVVTVEKAIQKQESKEQRGQRNPKKETTKDLNPSKERTSSNDGAVSILEEEAQSVGESGEKQKCHQESSKDTEDSDDSVVVEDGESEENEKSHQEDSKDTEDSDDSTEHENSEDVREKDQGNSHKIKEKDQESSHEIKEKDHDSSPESGEESYVTAETEEKLSVPSD